jgi:hypothetical protein
MREKRQLDDLRTENVEAIFEAIPKKDQKEWVIWKEGFRSWKPFTDFPQLLIGLRAGAAAEAPPPQIPLPPKDPVSEIKAPFTAENLTVGSLAIDDGTALGERDTRFPKRWDVKIFGESKVYANQTVNVSMHGMQLRDPAPAGLTNYFNVEIKAGEMKIPVMCSIIMDEKGKPTLRLKIEGNEYPNALQTALLQK